MLTHMSMSMPQSMSRRGFLSKSSALLAAAVAPTIIPASALGRGGLVPPSERINMGFIGVGGQGGGHLLGHAWTYVPGGYVARKDVQVLAVCDVRKERRDFAQKRANELYADKLGKPGFVGVNAYNDFREVLARPDIDAVLIALPYHWAAPMAIRAMRAGKDVYCEKPVAITVREGREVIETARRHSRVYQAGMQQRSEYGGKFRLACEMVRSGRIGTLKEVFAYRQPGAFYPRPWTSTNTQPLPDGLDWDLWLGPLPWRPYGGETGHALSGCFIGDVNWAPHHYDIIQWTVNPDVTAPIEVEYENQGSSPETAVIHYHYANGVVVHSTAYPGENVGNEGGACFVGTKGRIAVDRNGIVSHPGTILNDPLRSGDAHVYHANSHSGNFLECIRTRRQTICHPETAVYTMNAIFIGGISMALQRSVKWDPAKLEFPGDEAANRLRSYTPRPPWIL